MELVERQLPPPISSYCNQEARSLAVTKELPTVSRLILELSIVLSTCDLLAAVGVFLWFHTYRERVMADISFFAVLLTLMVLSVVFRGHPKTPEKLSTVEPAYEYADSLYKSNFSFSPTPSTSLSEDNAKYSDERKEIASEYDEHYVTKGHMPLDPTGTLPNEMENFQQSDDGFTFTTGEAELDATPTVEVDIPTNDTSIKLEENIPLKSAIILIKFAICMLTMLNFVCFFKTILMMVNNNFTFAYIKYKIMFKIYAKKPMLINEDCDDAFTV